MAPPLKDILLNRTQAADALWLSTGSFQKFVKLKMLHGVKPENQTVFPLSSVLAYDAWLRELPEDTEGLMCHLGVDGSIPTTPSIFFDPVKNAKDLADIKRLMGSDFDPNLLYSGYWPVAEEKAEWLIGKAILGDAVGFITEAGKIIGRVPGARATFGREIFIVEPDSMQDLKYHFHRPSPGPIVQLLGY